MSPVCFECGAPADVKHHVVPRVLGGKHAIDLCDNCHGKIHLHGIHTRALTIQGMAKKKERGEWCGGNLAYGLQIRPGEKIPRASPAECRRITKILRLYAKNQTIAEITRTLNKQNVPTRNGQPWQHATVRQIIRRNLPPEASNA